MARSLILILWSGRQILLCLSVHNVGIDFVRRQMSPSLVWLTPESSVTLKVFRQIFFFTVILFSHFCLLLHEEKKFCKIYFVNRKASYIYFPFLKIEYWRVLNMHPINRYLIQGMSQLRGFYTYHFHLMTVLLKCPMCSL